MNKRKQIMLGLLLGTLLTGCGSAKTSEAISYDTAPSEEVMMYAAEEEVAYEDAVAEDSGMAEGGMTDTVAEKLDENATKQERKLIKTIELYAETENYDALLASLEQQVTSMGGYIEYKYQYNGSHYSKYEENRSANLTIRIPVEKLEEFVGKVGEQSNIINKEERVKDVTLQYVDLESKKSALLTEQERLLELMEQAENVEDIVTIEQRLSEVRYELESMESQLRVLDNQIDYSTVYLNIEEVHRLTQTAEESFFSKIGTGIQENIYQIGDSIADIVLWFLVNIPYFVVWIVVIAVIIFVWKFVKKCRRGKKQAREMQEAELLKAAKEAEEEIKKDTTN